MTDCCNCHQGNVCRLCGRPMQGDGAPRQHTELQVRALAELVATALRKQYTGQGCVDQLATMERMLDMALTA